MSTLFHINVREPGSRGSRVFSCLEAIDGTVPSTNSLLNRTVLSNNSLLDITRQKFQEVQEYNPEVEGNLHNCYIKVVCNCCTCKTDLSLLDWELG